MYLLLVFTVDLVQEVKSEQVLADQYLVTIAQHLFFYPLTIKKRSVS